jgi:hypothetical protein
VIFLDACKLSFIASIAIVLPLLLAILSSIRVGLKGLSDLNFRCKRRSLGCFILSIVILLCILHCKLALLIVLE